MGTTELFPIEMKFSPNGRQFAVMSDKDFVISSSGVYRDSYAGSCADLAWNNNGDFAIKDNQVVRYFKGLKEEGHFKVKYSFDNIFGGALLGLRGADSIYFYDFESQLFISKIDHSVKNVIWSDNRTEVALISEDSTFIYKVSIKSIDEFIEANNEEDANVELTEKVFSLKYEIKDSIVKGLWYEDVLIYQTKKNKLSYLIEDQIFSITALNGNYTMLGFYQSTGKIYFMTKSFQMIHIQFPISYINYQCSILKKDYKAAESIFLDIPVEYHDKCCKFLEKFNLYELSYIKTTNQQRKLELAIKLKKLNDATVIATKLNSKENWKIVGDLAMSLGEFRIAEECMQMAKDYSGLLFYYSW